MMGLGVRARVTLLPWRGVRAFASQAPVERRVVYRGGPYMRKSWFYVAGSCFIIAGYVDLSHPELELWLFYPRLFDVAAPSE